MRQDTTNPETIKAPAAELPDDVKKLLEEARDEGFHNGYDAAARAHIQRTYGVWSPPPRQCDETDIDIGGECISCIAPGTWDF